jgi:hypothetical protein
MKRSSLAAPSLALGAVPVGFGGTAVAQVEPLNSACTKSATGEAELRAADLKLVRAIALYRRSPQNRNTLVTGAQRNLLRFLALENSSVRSIDVALGGSNLADVQRTAATAARQEQIRIAERTVVTLRLLDAPQYGARGIPSRVRVLAAQLRVRADRRAWYRSRGQLAVAVRPVPVGELSLTVPGTPFAFLPGALPQTSGTGRIFDEGGVQRLDLSARGLPANRRYTVFLTENGAPPLGRTVYVADFTTRGSDTGNVRLGTQVTRSFVFDGARTELNNVVVWFADQTADNLLFTGANATDPDADGDPGPTTPFDVDGRAGIAVLSGRITP